MAVFPKTEQNVRDLADKMVAGLALHGALFPSVTQAAQDALMMAIGDYTLARNNQIAAQAAAKNATLIRQEKQAALEEQMRKILYLAEHDCIETPGNLDYIGWGDRKTPSPLQKPGNLSGLTPTYEGPGTLKLSWDKPTTGGVVAEYHIERSDQPAGGGIPGPWTLLTTSYETQVIMANQPRGVELQYRVIATNAAGESMPSNIATVVL